MLEPLVFLIIFADINKDVSESNLLTFADDTKIHTVIYCCYLLQDSEYEPCL